MHKGHGRKTPSGLRPTKTKQGPLLENSNDAFGANQEAQLPLRPVKKEKMIFYCILDLELGWEFQFLVLISGTPSGGRIPIPFTIPKIPVGFFFEIPISGESENRNSDLRFSEFWQFLAQELSTSFCR